MKKLTILITLFCYSQSNAQNATNQAVFLEKWENSKEYLIAIAELMPENQYDFAPTTRQMTFKAQLLHITKNMHWLANSYFAAKKMDTLNESASKAELIGYVNNSFNHVKQAVAATSPTELTQKVDFFAGQKIKLQILNLLQDHVTHHRGQLIVYLNLNEITPPKYTGW